MKPTPPAAGPVVQRLTASGFAIDGAVHRAALLTPDRVLSWSPPPLAELSEEDLAPLLALDPAPEFVLIGAGPRHAFAPPALIAALDARGIGVEAMDSRAAARAWGLLRAEGRWIAAALMPL